MVANLIKKSSALSAQALLKFQNKKAALPILKLLKSAAASAVHNFNLSADNLFISNIFVDGGPMLKRFRPRAFGRAAAIQKKTSHLTLILEEKTPTARKMKTKTKTKVAVKEIQGGGEKPAAPKYETPKEIKPARKLGGFTRRIFRRKAIG